MPRKNKKGIVAQKRQQQVSIAAAALVGVAGKPINVAGELAFALA